MSWIAISIFLILLLIYQWQSKMIFKSQKKSLSEPFLSQYPIEELTFLTPKNGRISAVKYLSTKPAKGIVFYLHGTRGYHEHWDAIATNFISLGLDVVMVDYRGYGKSRGLRFPQSMLTDMDIVWEQIKADYDTRRKIVFGRSLGSVFACHVARNSSCDLLMLETPLYSLSRQALTKGIPKFLTYCLLYNYDNALLLSSVTCKVSIIHGTADTVVPLAEVQQLITDLNYSPEVLTIISDKGHFDLHEDQLYHHWLHCHLK